jgi:hypothetical protein
MRGFPKPHPKQCECDKRVLHLLLQILALLQKPNPGPKPELHLGVSRVVGRNIRMAQVAPIEIVDVEKVLLSIAPKDEDGRDMPNPNASWSSSDESVVSLQVASDTLSAEAISGAPGVATVSVTSGALTDTIEVTVKLGEPSSLNLSAGAPEHE